MTELSAPMPDDPNQLLSAENSRGVQKKALDPETKYINPYVERINLVDCRSQRFNISESGEMGFPSKDGFWVSLDGIIEFRVKPEEAARVFVTYNDDSVNQEIEASVAAIVRDRGLAGPASVAARAFLTKSRRGKLSTYEGMRIVSLLHSSRVKSKLTSFAFA